MLTLRHILLAHDLTSSSDAAVQFALRLARQFGATLHVVFADVLYGTSLEQASHLDAGLRASDDPAERLRAAAGIDTEGYDVRFAVVRGMAPAPALIDYAAEHDIDLIVTGTHGRHGLKRMMLGSVSEELVRRAPCPVLTVPQHTDAVHATVRKILVPVDFSEHSFRALLHAQAIARPLGARLTLLHVIEDKLHPAFYGFALQSIYDVDPHIEEKALAHLKDEFARAGGDETDADFIVRYGVAPSLLIDVAAEQQPDLIVMGTHGLTGIDRFFLGSVAEKVVRNAPCAVFTLKSFGKMLLAPDEMTAAHPQRT